MEEEITLKLPKSVAATVINLFQLLSVAGLRVHGEGSAIPSQDEIDRVFKVLVRAHVSQALARSAE